MRQRASSVTNLRDSFSYVVTQAYRLCASQRCNYRTKLSPSASLSGSLPAAQRTFQSVSRTGSFCLRVSPGFAFPGLHLRRLRATRFTHYVLRNTYHALRSSLFPALVELYILILRAGKVEVKRMNILIFGHCSSNGIFRVSLPLFFLLLPYVHAAFSAVRGREIPPGRREAPR